MVGKRASRIPSSRIPSSQAKKRTPAKSHRNTNQSDEYESFDNDSNSEAPETEAPKTKRRKVSNARNSKDNALLDSLFQIGPLPFPEPCAPSAGRPHTPSYHKPLFLSQDHGHEHRQSLLSWFDSVSTTRAMPWRKAWIDPGLTPDPTRLREQLERRAYEVWISEIMLQQTRVAVVIDYWNRWMEKWPTIHHLAAADPEDVLAAWRGLGYYSRATRIHEAAKLVVSDAVMQGLLPSVTAELEAKVPGVGRYTAGAISAIVFGRAAPMVDGNVLRVLSRQLGIYGNIKTDKKVIDTIWAAADALVRAVSQDRESKEETPNSDDVSDRPGRWGQALMELGSTICTPKPSCDLCPITASCRVYGEANKLRQTSSSTTNHMADIEDACTLCEPFDEDITQDTDLKALQETKTNTNAQPDKKQEKSKQMTLAAFAFTAKPAKPTPDKPKDESAAQEAISNYARKFPLKVAKKAVRVQEDIVCAIQRQDGRYLLQRRPEKGLLAGLWEFPSKSLADPNGCLSKQRAEMAKAHAHELLGSNEHGARLKHMGELGSVPWLFSHLKLTMHVHLFRLVGGGDFDVEPVLKGRLARWSADVEGESMGTGMRKCWDLVRGAEETFT